MPPLAITILALVEKYGPSAVDFIKKTIAITSQPEATREDWQKWADSAANLDYDAAIKAAEGKAK